MNKYHITYTFTEEVEYESITEAQSESDDAASGIGDTEGLTVVSVIVSRIAD